MGIYRATIAGAKPVYVRAKSANLAREMLVKLDALKSEEILDVFDNGAKTFKEGDVIELAEPPADPKPDPEPKTPPSTSKPSA
jgi:hypothetical protein